MKTFKDCLGNPIKVGDWIAGPARSACILHLRTGRVTGFDGEKIIIAWKKNAHGMSESAEGYTRLPKTMVLVKGPK